MAEHKRKHRKHNLGGENDETLHKNKYGFIEIDNPEYYNNNYYFSPPEYLMRKPTPFERMEMVINYIIRNNSKPINISTLATALAVSVRTMQTLLHSLQKDKIIEITPNYTSNGQQKENIYRYTGTPVEYYGSRLLVECYTIQITKPVSAITIGRTINLKNRAFRIVLTNWKT